MPSASFTYAEPPPPPTPMWSWTRDAIAAWLAAQDPAYQQTAQQLADLAGVDVIEHERRRAESPCACGFDGTPTKAHRATCEIGIIKTPARGKFVPRATTPEPDEDDDDLPF